MPVTTAMREANKKAHCNALDKVNVQSVWVTASQTVTAKNVVATDSISAGCLTTTSDARYKKNIKDTQLGLDFINKLRPVTYKLKNGNKFNDGLIAQELEQVYPEIVSESKTGKRVAYGNMIAPLIEAIKELSVKVDKLATENTELKERVFVLEQK